MYLPHVAFVLVLICSHHAWAIETDLRFPHIQAKRTKIEQILEDLKTILKTGNSSLGIPVLDPFIRDRLPIKIDDESVTLTGLLTNVDVRGVSEYDVLGGDFKVIGLKLTASLKWPLVKASTNYNMTGTLNKEIPVYGKGEIKATVRNFAFSIELGLGVRGQYLHVKSLNTKFSLGALEFKITGLLDDEELSEMISALISDMAPDVIRDYQEQIKKKLHPMAVKNVDAFLATKTLTEWLKLIS